ncbi:hypothetical protein M0802_012131 [Mischocyttarus mexicanus]|nr:hypothetical protein M0802_012131 [Mischocyttarus mexicanus]
MKRKSKAIQPVSSSNNEVERERRPEPTKAKKAHCFSCGSPDHSVKQCSALGKGPKCFRCNEFGHIASECQKRVNLIVASEDLESVVIQGKEFMALVDSGSDLTLLREDKFTEIGSVELTNTIKRAEEAGNGKIRIIGAFVGEINVDDVVCNIKIYVVPTSAIPNVCILGKNVLSNVEVIVQKGKVVKMVQIHEDEEKGKTKRSTELKDDTRSVDGENAEAVCEEDVMKGIALDAESKIRLDGYYCLQPLAIYLNAKTMNALEDIALRISILDDSFSVYTKNQTLRTTAAFGQMLKSKRITGVCFLKFSTNKTEIRLIEQIGLALPQLTTNKLTWTTCAFPILAGSIHSLNEHQTVRTALRKIKWPLRSQSVKTPYKQHRCQVSRFGGANCPYKEVMIFTAKSDVWTRPFPSSVQRYIAAAKPRYDKLENPWSLALQRGIALYHRLVWSVFGQAVKPLPGNDLKNCNSNDE